MRCAYPDEHVSDDFMHQVTHSAMTGRSAKESTVSLSGGTMKVSDKDECHYREVLSMRQAQSMLGGITRELTRQIAIDMDKADRGDDRKGNTHNAQRKRVLIQMIGIYFQDQADRYQLIMADGIGEAKRLEMAKHHWAYHNFVFQYLHYSQANLEEGVFFMTFSKDVYEVAKLADLSKLQLPARCKDPCAKREIAMLRLMSGGAVQMKKEKKKDTGGGGGGGATAKTGGGGGGGAFDKAMRDAGGMTRNQQQRLARKLGFGSENSGGGGGGGGGGRKGRGTGRGKQKGGGGGNGGGGRGGGQRNGGGKNNADAPDNSKKKCYNCQKIGHIANDCTNPKVPRYAEGDDPRDAEESGPT
jgi:hypothetical protein